MFCGRIPTADVVDYTMNEATLLLTYCDKVEEWKDESNKRDDVNRLKTLGVMNLADFKYLTPARPLTDDKYRSSSNHYFDR
jgi:hypothetical protein